MCTLPPLPPLPGWGMGWDGIIVNNIQTNHSTYIQKNGRKIIDFISRFPILTTRCFNSNALTMLLLLLLLLTTKGTNEWEGLPNPPEA